MNQPQSITSLPESPDDERRRRMIRYGVAMGIRVVCVVLCLFVHGWWLLVVAIGAVVLPYFGVVLANNSKRTSTAPLQAPAGAVTVYDPRAAEPTLLGSDDAFTGDVYTVAPESSAPGTTADDASTAGRPHDGTNS